MLVDVSLVVLFVTFYDVDVVNTSLVLMCSF